MKLTYRAWTLVTHLRRFNSRFASDRRRRIACGGNVIVEITRYLSVESAQRLSLTTRHDRRMTARDITAAIPRRRSMPAGRSCDRVRISLTDGQARARIITSTRAAPAKNHRAWPTSSSYFRELLSRTRAIHRVVYYRARAKPRGSKENSYWETFVKYGKKERERRGEREGEWGKGEQEGKDQLVPKYS